MRLVSLSPMDAQDGAVITNCNPNPCPGVDMNQRPWRFAALAPVGAVSLLVVEFARPPGSRFDSTPMPELPTKITLGEMRATGVRGLLVYCADNRCAHAAALVFPWSGRPRQRCCGRFPFPASVGWFTDANRQLSQVGHAHSGPQISIESFRTNPQDPLGGSSSLTACAWDGRRRRGK